MCFDRVTVRCERQTEGLETAAAGQCKWREEGLLSPLPRDQTAIPNFGGNRSKESPVSDLATLSTGRGWL